MADTPTIDQLLTELEKNPEQYADSSDALVIMAKGMTGALDKLTSLLTKGSAAPMDEEEASADDTPPDDDDGEGGDDGGEGDDDDDLGTGYEDLELGSPETMVAEDSLDVTELILAIPAQNRAIVTDVQSLCKAVQSLAKANQAQRIEIGQLRETLAAYVAAQDARAAAEADVLVNMSKAVLQINSDLRNIPEPTYTPGRRGRRGPAPAAVQPPADPPEYLGGDSARGEKRILAKARSTKILSAAHLRHFHLHRTFSPDATVDKGLRERIDAEIVPTFN